MWHCFLEQDDYELNYYRSGYYARGTICMQKHHKQTMLYKTKENELNVLFIFKHAPYVKYSSHVYCNICECVLPASVF